MKELENLLEDLDSGEEIETKYGICYAYSPDVVDELKQALIELQAIKESNPSEALEETKEFFKRRCVANCGHNANESCICKIAQCFKELENVEQVLLKAQEMEKVLEDELGISLLELKPVESASIDCSACLVNGVLEKKIYICGDDYYGTYTLDEYRKLVLKDIICGSLYAMQQLKEDKNER